MATKLDVRVNRKRPESMTRQIREQLNDLIDAGALAAGTLLPSERELANTLKVARNVVRGAYEQLMDAGKLVSEGRKGRTVGRSSGGRSTATRSAGSKSGGSKSGGSKSSGGGTKKKSTGKTSKSKARKK